MGTTTPATPGVRSPAWPADHGSDRSAAARSRTDDAILATGLVKRFGKTEALRGLDLRAARGTVLGVLGPNGAGKTTAVRILTTLLDADAGSASVFGYDVATEPQQVRLRVGVTGQFAAVDELLSGSENLMLVGRLAGMTRRRAAARAGELLERFDLTAVAPRTAKTYSGGLRRRLDVAASLMTEPPLLVLDEPTTGLDPRTRMQVWELVDSLVREGTTVLLTSQYLDEVDRLAHNVAVVDGGRVIAEGTPDDLKAKVGGSRLTVTLAADASLDEAARVVAPYGIGDVRVEASRREVCVPVAAGSGVVPSVVRGLDDAGIEIEDAAIRHATLDDVFLNLTGRHTASGEGRPS